MDDDCRESEDDFGGPYPPPPDALSRAIRRGHALAEVRRRLSFIETRLMLVGRTEIVEMIEDTISVIDKALAAGRG